MKVEKEVEKHKKQGRNKLKFLGIMSYIKWKGHFNAGMEKKEWKNGYEQEMF